MPPHGPGRERGCRAGAGSRHWPLAAARLSAAGCQADLGRLETSFGFSSAYVRAGGPGGTQAPAEAGDGAADAPGAAPAALLRRGHGHGHTPRPGGGRPIGGSAIGFPSSARWLGARFLAARAERRERQDGGQGAQRLAESQWEGEAVPRGGPGPAAPPPGDVVAARRCGGGAWEWRGGEARAVRPAPSLVSARGDCGPRAGVGRREGEGLGESAFPGVSPLPGPALDTSLSRAGGSGFLACPWPGGGEERSPGGTRWIRSAGRPVPTGTSPESAGGGSLTARCYPCAFHFSCAGSPDRPVGWNPRGVLFQPASVKENDNLRPSHFF